MEQICPANQCTGCATCFNVCPVQCITMKENEEGFLYPYIDHSKCMNCGLCQRKCPAITEMRFQPAEFYMAWHNDMDILKSSSSGGVFTALAHYVLRRNGVVFGAVMDQTTREVFHTYIEDESQLQKLRSSKYYQSNVKDIYKQVKDHLSKNEYV